MRFGGKVNRESIVVREVYIERRNRERGKIEIESERNVLKGLLRIEFEKRFNYVLSVCVCNFFYKYVWIIGFFNVILY